MMHHGEVLIFVQRALLGMVRYLKGEIGVKPIINRSWVGEPHCPHLGWARGGQAQPDIAEIRRLDRIIAIKKASKFKIGFIVERRIICLDDAFGY